MEKKLKIRGWLIIIVGVVLTYLIQPILIQSRFALTSQISQANLAYAGVILGIGGNILICLGLIVIIVKWAQSRFLKENKNLSKK
ncbi:MAG: hypothetical protein WC458_02025 [Patescibacteria group bacterium]|jgi:hypothetical protein